MKQTSQLIKWMLVTQSRRKISQNEEEEGADREHQVQKCSSVCSCHGWGMEQVFLPQVQCMYGL